MATTKLFLRPNPIPSTIFHSSTHLLFTKPKFTTTLSVFSSVYAATTSTNCPLPYGPSLFKGKTLQPPKRTQQQQEDETKPIFDESQFTRIFNIAALRVPAKDCYALESRLRGHLLNWPRVRNIARVPGDEMEAEFITLLQHNNNENDEESVDHLNSVLYRDKLVKSFNVRGFVKFRNLAKISRPKRRKRKKKKGEDEKGNGRKEEFYVVEVVEQESEEMKGLLGEGFRGGEKWKGATRLLLLDEELVGKDVEEFPEAIKVSCEFISIANSIFLLC